MKKYFLPLLTVLTMALFTTSCEKDQVTEQAPISTTVAHDANAFEYVGVQHNQGLDYFVANADFRDPRRDMFPLTIRYCETLGYSRADIEKTLYDPETYAVITAANPADALRDYFRANNMSQDLAYLDRMEDAIVQSASAADAVRSLERIEQAVQEDKSLSTASQESLLQGLAVGKHSAVYWSDQIAQGPRSPWVTNAPGGPSAARINWGAVVMADLGGAIKGGVKGAILASVSNLLDQIF
jgi:hypothetical protein